MKLQIDNISKRAYNKIFEISEDDRIRELVRQREKSEMDYYAGLSSALNKGIAKGENNIIEKMRTNLCSVNSADFRF